MAELCKTQYRLISEFKGRQSGAGDEIRTRNLDLGKVLPYHWATPAGIEGCLERVAGIEPAWPAWKAGTLPLSYTRAPKDYTNPIRRCHRFNARTKPRMGPKCSLLASHDGIEPLRSKPQDQPMSA